MSTAEIIDLKQFITTTVAVTVSELLVPVVEDLKQYVTATISQSEARLESRLGARIDLLENNMNDGFSAVGEAIDRIHDSLDNHENRIATLEKSS